MAYSLAVVSKETANLVKGDQILTVSSQGEQKMRTITDNDLVIVADTFKKLLIFTKAELKKSKGWVKSHDLAQITRQSKRLETYYSLSKKFTPDKNAIVIKPEIVDGKYQETWTDKTVPMAKAIKRGLQPTLRLVMFDCLNNSEDNDE